VAGRGRARRMGGFRPDLVRPLGFDLPWLCHVGPPNVQPKPDIVAWAMKFLATRVNKAIKGLSSFLQFWYCRHGPISCNFCSIVQKKKTLQFCSILMMMTCIRVIATKYQNLESWLKYHTSSRCAHVIPTEYQPSYKGKLKEISFS
jgi:hypothetical protein